MGKILGRYVERASVFLKFANNKGFFDVLISNILIGFVGFGGQFFVAWILAPEDMGRIKIFQSYIQLASLFAVFGFDTSIVKICSDLNYKLNIKHIVIRTIKVVILISLISYLVFLFLNYLDLFGDDQSIKRSFYLYSCVFIFMGINKVLFGFLQSQKMFRIYSKLQLFSKIIALLLIVILTYFFYIDGFFIGMLFGFALTTFLLFRVVYVKLKDIEIVKVKGVFTYQWFLARNSFYSNISGTGSALIGVFLLNYLTSDMREIGFYSFALVIGMGLSMITASVQKVVFPYLSSKSGNINAFITDVKKYSKILLITALIVSLLCVFILPPFLDLLLDNKYTESNNYIILVIINWLIVSTYAIKGIGLTALGDVRVNAAISISRLVVNTILSYIFILNIGVMGAIVSLILTNTITALTYNLYYLNSDCFKINCKNNVF